MTAAVLRGLWDINYCAVAQCQQAAPSAERIENIRLTWFENSNCEGTEQLHRVMVLAGFE